MIFLSIAGTDVISDVQLRNHRWSYKNRKKFSIGLCRFKLKTELEECMSSFDASQGSTTLPHNCHQTDRTTLLQSIKCILMDRKIKIPTSF